MSNKSKVTIERELSSSSQKFVWNLIATATGLSRWVAPRVEEADNILTFIWGKPMEDPEVRRAEIIAMKKNRYIRFKWTDEEDEEAYTELEMDKLEVSDHYVLRIIDFCDNGEEEQMKKMWNHDLDRLHRNTGA